MVRDYEWTKNATRCLSEFRLAPFDVEEAVRLGHDRRRPNRPRSREDADWITSFKDPEGRGTIVVAYDWPAREEEDESRARLVACWLA